MSETDALLHILEAGLPSERAAVAEAIRRKPEMLSQQQLLEVVTREPIATIRRSLENALRRQQSSFESPRPPAASEECDAVQQYQNRLRNLAGLISHETEFPIGQLRRAASKELGVAFGASETNRSIEALRQRLEGLVLLAEVSRPLLLSRFNVADVVKKSIPGYVGHGLPSRIAQPAQFVEVVADERILEIVLSNALRNAIEATITAACDPEEIVIETSTNGRDFWVTIRNKFRGTTFTLDEVANTGMSTKDGHKGYGVSAMRYGAERLGLTVSLTGQAGVAVFNLRGPTNNAR